MVHILTWSFLFSWKAQNFPNCRNLNQSIPPIYISACYFCFFETPKFNQFVQITQRSIYINRLQHPPVLVRFFKILLQGPNYLNLLIDSSTLLSTNFQKAQILINWPNLVNPSNSMFVLSREAQFFPNCLLLYIIFYPNFILAQFFNFFKRPKFCHCLKHIPIRNITWRVKLMMLPIFAKNLKPTFFARKNLKSICVTFILSHKVNAIVVPDLSEY